MNVVNLTSKRKHHQPQDHRRSIAKQKFAWIDRIVLDRNVPHFACRVAVLISNKYLNRTSGDAWPSQSKLAADLGVCRRTIQYALDTLIETGHIAVQVSRGRVNHYRPIFKAEDAQSGAQVDAQQAAQVELVGAQSDAPDLRNLTTGGYANSFAHNPSKRTLLSNPERESTRPPIEKKEPIGKKEQTGWPEGFRLTANLMAYAERKNFSQSKAENMFEAFQNNSIANGKTFSNWEFGWRSWVDKENKFKRDEPDRNRIDDRL
jgi:biotin operon repressor